MSMSGANYDGGGGIGMGMCKKIYTVYTTKLTFVLYLVRETNRKVVFSLQESVKWSKFIVPHHIDIQ